MKTKKISFDYVEYDYSELKKSDQELIDEARKACEKAYAPYSQFNVGVALRMENNEIIRGNNQENCAYPSGLCAERVALFWASANYPNLKVNAMAITVKTNLFAVESPLSPCGSCRQVMTEYEQKQGKHIRILLADDNKRVWEIEKATDLLPFFFHENKLQK